MEFGGRIMKNIIITILVLSNLFLMLCIVAMINTTNNVRIENQELLEMLDYQIPTEEENF